MATPSISLSLLKLSLGPDILDIHNNITSLPLDNPIHILWTTANNVTQNGVLLQYIKHNWPKYTDESVSDLFDNAQDNFAKIKQTIVNP